MISWNVGQARNIALASVQLRRDRQVTGLRQSPAEVLDVFMHAEDFLHDEDRRQVLPAGGRARYAGDLAVLHLDLHLARFEAVRYRS